LRPGQQATVLQMPVGPRATAAEPEHLATV
jgi:hypothetical protein